MRTTNLFYDFRDFEYNKIVDDCYETIKKDAHFLNSCQWWIQHNFYIDLQRLNWNGFIGATVNIC